MNFDFLAFRQTVYHLYGQLFESTLRRYGLTQLEMDVLLFLANHPQCDTAAELVSVRHLAKSQVSVSVDVLVNGGYLSREPQGRRIHLKLQPSAQPLIEEAGACQQKFFDTILRDISQEERKTLGGLMDRITDNARGACK